VTPEPWGSGHAGLGGLAQAREPRALLGALQKDDVLEVGQLPRGVGRILVLSVGQPASGDLTAHGVGHDDVGLGALDELVECLGVESEGALAVAV
jgi:hypothetical protein